MTTTEATSALVQQSLTDKQIQTRIELNKQAGWGLEKGNPAQLNMIFLICQKYDLLPGEDLTLYDGKPWITIDGRVKLMRRHPEYRGFSTRPLSTNEKNDWGYDPDDIVVEATIRTSTWGDITEYGKVSKAEREGASQHNQRLNYVARIHPVEMARKRALARAERFAFGQEAVIDDDQAEQIARMVVEERDDPERVAMNASAYSRIFGEDEDHTMFDLPTPAVEHESQDVPENIDRRQAALDEWAAVTEEAERLSIVHKDLPTNAEAELIERWTIALTKKVKEGVSVK